MEPEGYAPPLVPAVPHPPVGEGGYTSLPAPPVLDTRASPLPPLVLRVLPLWGSSAPVGYIYDATPDPEEGLLAAAPAFFSHQGHQVFHDPCPDLAEYHRAMGVSSSAVVSVDRLPDHLLSSGLELMAGLCAPSPTDAEFMGTMFMATYLSPSPQVSSSVGGPSVSSSVAARGNVAPPVSSVGGPHVGLSVGGPPFPLSAATWGNVAPPVSCLGGVGIQGGPSPGGPVDAGVSPPPRRSSELSFRGGSSPPSALPVRTPYLNSYRPLYSDLGGFPIYRPHPAMTFVGSGASAVSDSIPSHHAPRAPRPSHRPDPDKDVVHSPPSSRSLLPSSVSFGGQSAWLGIPIFGSDIWDPHRKRNSGSVSDSEDSGRKIFNQIPLLKNREIGISISKFGIQKKITWEFNTSHFANDVNRDRSAGIVGLIGCLIIST
jgi:hypothetical protein